MSGLSVSGLGMSTIGNKLDDGSRCIKIVRNWFIIELKFKSSCNKYSRCEKAKKKQHTGKFGRRLYYIKNNLPRYYFD